MITTCEALGDFNSFIAEIKSSGNLHQAWKLLFDVDH